MRSHIHDNVGHFGASLYKNGAQRLSFGSSIPWIEPLVEIGPRGAHGVPKYRVHGLKKARTPSSNGKLTTRTNVLPKLRPLIADEVIE